MTLADRGHQTGHINYVALRLAQMRKRKLGRGEDAHQVKLEQVTKFLNRKIVDRFMRRMPSGIVDKTVESPVTRNRGIDQVSNVLSSGNIAEDERSLARTLRASQVAQ